MIIWVIRRIKKTWKYQKFYSTFEKIMKSRFGLGHLNSSHFRTYSLLELWAHLIMIMLNYHLNIQTQPPSWPYWFYRFSIIGEASLMTSMLSLKVGVAIWQVSWSPILDQVIVTMCHDLTFSFDHVICIAQNRNRLVSVCERLWLRRYLHFPFFHPSKHLTCRQQD